MKTIKVLAGSLAAITAGATLALGIFGAPITSLGDYVKISGNALNSPVIVIGDGATASSGFAQDVVGAADIAAAVAGYATTSVSTGVAGMGVSNGVDISTANTKLYLDDPLSKSGVHATLTKLDLPELLASGIMTDTSGTVYNYDQYITLNGVTAPTFSNSNSDLTDPDFLLNLSSAAASPAINYTVTFNKLLNISNSNVQNQKLKLFGTEYTIGSTSACAGAGCAGANDQLVLYGSSLVQSMSGGETKTINVDGTDHTVKFLGASGDTTAAISVDGMSQSVTKGTSYTISSLPIYVEDVFRLSTTDQTQNSVKLSFGTNKLTLKDGQPVKKGTADDTISGTLVQLTGTAGQGLSKIVVAMAAKDSNHDYVQQGTAFTDPVFGAFKLALGGFDGGSTETITVDNAGTTGASLKFTDYRGKQGTLQWAYTGTTSFAPSLNSTSTQTYVVVENQTVKLNDYVLLTPSQESDFSHIVQYTTASGLGSSGAYIELKDVMSGSTSRVYLDASTGYGMATFYVDGQAYYAYNQSSNLTQYQFTWGDATAGLCKTGAKITVFPLVRTSKGGWLTLAGGNSSVLTTQAVPITAGSTILELPGGDVTVTAQTNAVNITCKGTVMAGTVYSSGASCAPGRLAYNITAKNASVVYVNPQVSGGAELQYPAVIFREEKAKDASNIDVQDFVVTTMGAGTGTGVSLVIQAPNLTATTQNDANLQSDNSVSAIRLRRRGRRQTNSERSA